MIKNDLILRSALYQDVILQVFVLETSEEYLFQLSDGS